MVVLTRTHNPGYRPYGTHPSEINHSCVEVKRKISVRKFNPSDPNSREVQVYTITYDCGKCVGTELVKEES